MSPTFKIAIVGEAWGETEAQWGKPFVGAAGQELNRMLGDAGIVREQCYVTNVFNLQPRNNDLKTLTGPKNSGDVVLSRPALVPGGYLLRPYEAEVDRLLGELESVRPNITVLLGNTACWAVLGGGAISKIRGTASISPVVHGLKVLPTYHPAAVLRQYDLRHVTVLDLQKARVESEFPELRRPLREIWIEPTLNNIREFKARWLDGAAEIAFDIETAAEQITCIGFAPSIDRALVIPFVDQRKPSGSYWSTQAEEVEAWRLVAEILALPAAKVGQNTLYDIQYLWQKYGIPVTNYTEDTMLLHHSLHPESPKGLDFLGSVYTNEVAWKVNRPRGEHTIKRED